MRNVGRNVARKSVIRGVTSPALSRIAAHPETSREIPARPLTSRDGYGTVRELLIAVRHVGAQHQKDITIGKRERAA